MAEPVTDTVVSPSSPSARPLWAARVVVFVAFADLFVHYPLAAPYAASLGATPVAIGLIVASYSVANLVGNVGAGFVLDRFGRVRPILVSLALTALVVATYAYARTPLQLAVTRIAHGLVVAALAPGAFALTGDAAPPTRRTRAMSVNGTLIALAAILAPSLAGVVQSRSGFSTAFLLDAAVLATSIPVVALLLRRWRSDIPRPVTPTPSRLSQSVVRLVQRPLLRASYAAIFSFTLSLGILVTFLPLALVARGGSASERGLAFSLYALAAVLAMSLSTPTLSLFGRRVNPLATGCALIAAGLLVLSTSIERLSVALGMTVYGLGFGVLFPIASALVVDATHPRERGSAFGVFYALYSVGVVLGSVLAGALAGWLGTTSTLPFAVPAVLSLVIALMVSRAPASRLRSPG